MAKFSLAEHELLTIIKDDRLQTNLAAIRQAVEDVWAPDAPRIIKDYTDHGLLHYERIAGFATKLLEANDGRQLSSEECYLLLAGIYLHDIGMQCDVLKFPGIKDRAMQLGAQFAHSFTASTASNYSLDEQKDIRKNHQYLSAAWIDWANRTGKSVLGGAAQSMPKTLVDDLMDVCKHHTKLPITDCPIPFKFDPSQRKQLVAAILRFADELDIDSRRVSLETVKTFSFDPKNSVYWWLHNQTSIVFTTRNVLLITIRLNPGDLNRSGPYIHDAFITEFQSKNRPVLTVLAQNGVPIIISADSKVVANDREDPMPGEMVTVLKELQKKEDPLRDLAEELRVWLRAIRYETSDIRRQGNRVADLTATLELGTVKQRVLVRCIGGEINQSDIKEVDGLLDRKTPQAWLISDMRVSPSTRDHVASADSVQVFTLAEFLKQKVWGSYFDFLTALVDKDRIPELYVDAGCYKQEVNEKNMPAKESHKSLESYIDRWLKERGKMHVSLLGSFGTGKTWFCRHYAHQQLNRYLSDPAKERLPLLITLRAFAKAMTAEQLINDALLEQYKLQFMGSAFEIFQEMNRRGKLLLILDGFDEMARQVDYQTVVDNFWELARLVDENSKVILTSRTEYFRWAEESEKILAGREFGRKILVLEPPKFEVIHLEEFNDDQIKEVILRRNRGDVDIADRILKNRNLAEMARRPILIELLLAALQEVNANVLDNPGQVYLYATNKLLLRNIDTRRTFTTTADKLYFLCELAWEMIKTENLRIHYGSIPDRIKSYFGDRIRDQHELDTWDFDLRNQTLLHRDAAGYYEFAHKSLAEYFVAFKFAAELGCLDSVFTQAYREADGQPCKFAIEQKTAPGLADTFGAMALIDPVMAAITTFLGQMIDKTRISHLWTIIEQTRALGDGAGFIAANAVTLLARLGESFFGRDLSRLVLRRALLPHDLRNVTFEGSDLNDTRLAARDLRGANLKRTALSAGCLVGADLRTTLGVNATFTKFVSPEVFELSRDWQGWESFYRRPRLTTQQRDTALSFWAQAHGIQVGSKILESRRQLLELISRNDTSGIIAITGPSGTGKSRLLSSIVAESSRSLMHRRIFWYSDMASWTTWHGKNTNFYRDLATFLTVCDHPEFFSYLDNNHAFAPHLVQRPIAFSSIMTIDDVLSNGLSIVRKVLERENLIICLDDLDETASGLMSFVTYFMERTIAATIIAVFQKFPAIFARSGYTEYRLGSDF